MTRNYTDKTYRSWQSMRQRCSNPARASYPYYGGRGIKVCERWNSFDNFLKDMGERPDGMWIDRIDGNGDYCPENCRWSTPKEQCRNRSSNRVITHNGQSRLMVEWSELKGIPLRTLSRRINDGWPIERALEARQ